MDDETKELIAEARREYHRNWRKQNADKVQRIRERYWLNRALDSLRNNSVLEDSRAIDSTQRK